MILLFLILPFLYSDSTSLIFENEYAGFQNARSITVDGLGAIYVLDKELSEITKLDKDLNKLLKSGGVGWGQNQFIAPEYIDASSGLDILVSDFQNNRIQRLDLNLTFISELQTNALTFPDDFKVVNPRATLVINSKDLFILDGNNPRIVVFKNGQTPVAGFGGFGSGRAELIQPEKIVKNNDNLLFIFDRGKKSIMKFDNFGNFLGEIKKDNIVSISIFDNILYILTNSEVWLFNTTSNQFDLKYDLPDLLKHSRVKDFYVYNKERYLFLSDKKLSSWKLKP